MSTLNDLNAAMAGLWQKRAELLQNQTEHWKAQAEYWKTQKELSASRWNHLTTRLFEASGIPGLGCAKLKNGYNVPCAKMPHIQAY